MSRLKNLTLVCAAALASSGLGGGCVRRPEPAQEKPVRAHEPGLSITTYEKGPRRYEVISTNQDNSMRTYRFVPRQ